MQPHDYLMHTDMLPQETQNVLMHHGVKGMRWGVRRNRNSSGQKRESFRDYHKRVKADKAQWRQNRANQLLEETGRHGNNVLVRTIEPGQMVPTLMGGENFHKMVRNGAMFDVDNTDIVFQRNKPDEDFSDYWGPARGAYKRPKRNK